MSEYTSYYLYEKCEIMGGNAYGLGIYSVDGNGTMPIVVKQECDKLCGCPEPITRWLETSSTTCVNTVMPLYRWEKTNITSCEYYETAIYRWVQTENVECDEYIPEYPTTAITYTASTKLNADLTAFIPSASAETYDNETGVGVIEFPIPVTEISDLAFSGKTELTNIVIPNTVTRIGGGAFSRCTGLTEINIPYGVVQIDYEAFESCYSLSSVTIPNSVKYIELDAFYRCISLTSIVIPNSVETIGADAFVECDTLTAVTIGTGITEIGLGAFDMCYVLTSITINATTPPTLGSQAFDYTNNCPIYVPSASVNAYKAANNWSGYASRIYPII